MFVVQTSCHLYLMLATVFNCATWRAPWIWIVCYTQSFEIEIVVRRTAQCALVCVDALLAAVAVVVVLCAAAASVIFDCVAVMA